jgi:hypothetical protein
MSAQRQPPTALDTLRFHHALQDVFGDDEEVLDGGDAGGFLGGGAVDIGAAGGAVLNDCGADFTGGR